MAASSPPPPPDAADVGAPSESKMDEKDLCRLFRLFSEAGGNPSHPVSLLALYGEEIQFHERHFTSSHDLETALRKFSEWFRNVPARFLDRVVGNSVWILTKTGTTHCVDEPPRWVETETGAMHGRTFRFGNYAILADAIVAFHYSGSCVDVTIASKHGTGNVEVHASTHADAKRVFEFLNGKE